MKKLKRKLIDFQNFLILDGQLDISPGEVKQNARVFCDDTSNAEESREFRKEIIKEHFLDLKN